MERGEQSSVVELPWPPKELTPNARCHWRKVHKAKQLYKAECALVLLTQQVPRCSGREGRIPLAITICPPDRRKRDRDNMQSALKYALDTLALKLGVDDYLFDPTYHFADPVPGGMVAVEIGSSHSPEEPAVEWRSLSWLTNYEVSEFGDLRRTKTVRNHSAGTLLKKQVTKGYVHYTVRLNGRGVGVRASRLVCEAWHGKPPTPQHQTAHNDGDRSNNHYTNLRWATHLENEADKLIHGTILRGTSHCLAKLNWDAVRDIRESYANGSMNAPALARKYNVHKTSIYNVLTGVTWAGDRA